MRPAQLAVVALVSAVLGGLCVLGIGKAAGWIGKERTHTVVLPAPAPGEPPSLPPVKPLLGNGFDAAAIYAHRSPGVVTIFAFFGPLSSDAAAAQGSGFIVSSDGVILTNSHVITDAGQHPPGSPIHPAAHLFVEFADRDRVPAKVVGWDVFDDVGVLRVDPKAHVLTPLPLGDSSRVRVGEPVAAIGSPFGNENSLAVGVVSATRRSIESLTSSYDLVDAIQVDAPINHGNSGGPLFDAHGEVIGINAQIRSESGNGEGVGFAVPINSARRSMEQLLASGTVAYAYVGITTDDLTPTLARHLHIQALHGALVDSVRPGSPGARAGLRGGSSEEQFNGEFVRPGGDVILAIDGQRVRSAEDVVRVVTEQLSPGQGAIFTILRGTEQRNVRVVLAERPANPGGVR